MENIFEFTESIKNDYIRYSSSFNMVKSEDIREKLQEYYRTGSEEGQFCPEPLIQINPHYEITNTVPQLVDKGLLHPRCKDIFRFGESEMKLYSHQAEAIGCARDNKNFIVTTGTGSGKSLSFFIPIVDRILRGRENDSKARTRAIVIYPMNALANSQMSELGKFLHNSPGAFSYGIYTGQEDTAERKRVAENPPDILLTNFMMMELLLTRHNENDLRVIGNCKGLEFLVLDELHTYRGRQGADVAMLIRRLRERTRAKDLICVGTSATMSNVGEKDEQEVSVAEVGRILFGINERPDVITERPKHVTDSRYNVSSVKPLLASRVREFAQGTASLKSYEDFRKDPLAIWTEHTLGIDDSGSPKRAKPLSLSFAAKKLAEDAEGITIDEARTALSSFLIHTYSLVMPYGKKPFAFRLHQFIGAPGKLYISLEPAGERTVTMTAQKYVPGRAKDYIRLYSVYFCRECGHEYMPVWYDKETDSYLPREIDDFGEDDLAPGFLTPAPSDAEDFPEIIPVSWSEPGNEDKIKREYKKFIPTLVHVAPNGKANGPGAQNYWFIGDKFRYCTECGEETEPRGRDINRLSGLTGEGRSSATTILSLSMLEHLYKNPPKDNENETRKILGFIDNRQDAALQSGHFNNFIFLITLRAAIITAVKENGGTAKLADLPKIMESALRFNDGSDTTDLEFMKQIMKGRLKQNAHAILRDVLGFRALRDVRRGWRFNNPNLEKLGLLEIAFEDLKEFSEDDDIFNESDFLSPLSPKDREKLAGFILTDMARSMCINSRYLKEEEQQKIMSTSQNMLREPWNFDRDDLFTSKMLQVGGKLDKKAHKAVSCGAQSRFLKALKKWMQKQESAELRNLFISIETTACKVSAWQAVISDFCEAAHKYGIMSKIIEKDNNFYQINEDVLIWSIPADQANGGVNNYFRGLYASLVEQMQSGKMDIFRLESREHTAQIDSVERKLLEKRFRYETKDKEELQNSEGILPKRLPLLYCSPTMELGVDIASLNVVYMRNVPPTPANYAQRSGRAGRSGQPALVVSYCGAHSPHDRWFFEHQEQMVQGEVAPPNLDLMNEELVTSHIHSIWLGEIDFDIPPKISEVLDMEEPGGNMPLIKPIRDAVNDPKTNNSALQMAKAFIDVIEITGESPGWLVDNFAEQVIKESPEKFDKAFDRWRSLYSSTQEQIKRSNEITERLGGDPKEKSDAQRRAAEAISQQKVLQGSGSELNSDFNTYRYLANQGFLPGYNFPRLPLMAWVPGSSEENSSGRMITRQRFLAISEFGPRSLIYHRGKTFRVVRAKIEKATGQISSGTYLPTERIKICSQCGCGNKVTSDAEGTTSNICQNCRSQLTDKGLINYLYRIEAVETQPVERISINDEERRRQGFEIQTSYQFLPGLNGIEKSEKKILAPDGSTVMDITYSPSAQIWKINKGWRRRGNKAQYGFTINPMTGYWSKEVKGDESEDQKTTEDDAIERAPSQVVVPYVEDRRNIMILAPAMDLDKEDMATIQAALRRGIETIFEIEESELAAEALPSKDDRKTILLYEASEGGAGVLSRIAKEPELFRSIARKALEIMHYDYKTGYDINTLTAEYEAKINRKEATCETGCYSCLLSYYNQPDHELIDRRRPGVLRFLIALAECDAWEQKETVKPQGKVAEWLAELDRFSLRRPDEIGFSNGKINADAIYREHCAIVVIGEAMRETLENAEKIGYSLIEFPPDISKWPEVFDCNKQIFGERR
jgi:Lhr-like helicase